MHTAAQKPFGVQGFIANMQVISSFSRLLAYEAARILFRLGCDARVYDPTGLPQKDDVSHMHRKVQELRDLSKWSDGHVWISPEQHGNLVCQCPVLQEAQNQRFTFELTMIPRRP